MLVRRDYIALATIYVCLSPKAVDYITLKWLVRCSYSEHTIYAIDTLQAYIALLRHYSPQLHFRNQLGTYVSSHFRESNQVSTQSGGDQSLM